MLKTLAEVSLGAMIGVGVVLAYQLALQSPTVGDIICFDNSGTPIFTMRDVEIVYRGNDTLVKNPEGDIRISRTVQCFVMSSNP